MTLIHGMEPTRREFALMAGAALAAASTGTAVAAPRPGAGVYPPDAWHQRMKRIVHVNFNERDPETFDVERWADYLASCQAQMTYLSGTNVVAFYPTGLPDLPVSAWLKGRDVFGECVAAAKARGIRVMGRFSIDIAKSQLADRHPDWFCRTQDGALVRRSLVGAPDDPSASSEFAPTCQFSDYYTTFVPALFDEVLSRYPIDGIYSNGWPSPDAVVCYCPICRTIGDPHSRAYEDAFLKRAVELWGRYDALVKKHDARLIFTGNLGGGFRGGTLDLSALAATAPWFMADNQGRGGIGAPAWDASQQTRIGKAIVGNSPGGKGGTAPSPTSRRGMRSPATSAGATSPATRWRCARASTRRWRRAGWSTTTGWAISRVSSRIGAGRRWGGRCWPGRPPTTVISTTVVRSPAWPWWCPSAATACTTRRRARTR
ncbi:hypothetical protein [Nitrospirillum sp. BR 11163]|uniref:hypothetical protein n=1 Tax=Nitrospirillum sp. BR 11163 TaxID=3104323 RepID=UPI002AFF49D6|nr:hypothetical protein [Nitrospirillum sp. BR 11163]MEA1676002.1 hypothetical protein [Nitrospirillum sp. BR 11163]